MLVQQHQQHGGDQAKLANGFNQFDDGVAAEHAFEAGQGAELGEFWCD